MGIRSSRQSCVQVCTLRKKVNGVETKVVLTERGLQARDLGSKKRFQVSSFAAHRYTHLVVADHGVDFDAPECRGTHTDVHLRLSQSVH